MFKLLLTILISTSLSSASPHPLDPLTPEEIHQTVLIIQKIRPNPKWVFNYITLKEPRKSLLLQSFLKNSSPPKGIPRKAFAILLDRSKEKVYEALVNLHMGRIEKWTEISGVQPPFTDDELTQAEEIIRSNPEVMRRCEAQGFPNMSLVNGDQWSIGYVGDRPEYEGRRLIQTYLYGRVFENDNEYAHPFDFLPIVDLNKGEVIKIEELPTYEDFEKTGGTSVPKEPRNYHPDLRDSSTYRKDLKPVKVSNPDGVSYKVHGNEISWQKFKFRVGFTGREGPVLHQVSYKDGIVRPLFYRLSLAELFVPYGDPRPPYHRKHVYDEGQYGIGSSLNSLNPGEDMLGTAHCFDGILNNEKGKVVKIKRAFCIHEEDAGILWKHVDPRTGKYVVVRAQRLVLTFIVTSGNYDYIFSWSFYQDGSIEFNIKLSGILSTNLVAPGATPKYGVVVAPQIYAMLHQHFFNLRIDADIDGNKNTVILSDFVALNGSTGSKENPYGQGMTVKKTKIRTVSEGRTKPAPEKSRAWVIINPSKKNPVTKGPVGWKLVPTSQIPSGVTKKDSPYHDQEGFMDYSAWVTPYNDEQMFPGGNYLQSGLPAWVKKNPKASVENKDVVLWFTLGLAHVPRTEDFPVMPRESCGIMLHPYNFFVENPALDVPGYSK